MQKTRIEIPKISRSFGKSILPSVKQSGNSCFRCSSRSLAKDGVHCSILSGWSLFSIDNCLYHYLGIRCIGIPSPCRYACSKPSCRGYRICFRPLNPPVWVVGCFNLFAKHFKDKNLTQRRKGRGDAEKRQRREIHGEHLLRTFTAQHGLPSHRWF